MTSQGLEAGPTRKGVLKEFFSPKGIWNLTIKV